MVLFYSQKQELIIQNGSVFSFKTKIRQTQGSDKKLCGFINHTNELYHYGVLGMKWGVRKDRSAGGNRTRSRETITTKTKSGVDVVLGQNRTPAFAEFLAKHSKKVRETLDNSKSFKISVDGKTVGELDLYKESPDSLNVVWVSISKENEGRGYGSSVMKATIDYARKTNCKQVTLEVPKTSPNARHIYEKLGFKTFGESLGDEDDAWGGLTQMRLKL